MENYLIKKRIGKGGTAKVYSAVHKVTNQNVVLKNLLQPSKFVQPEKEIWQSIQHIPGIVKLLDTFTLDDGNTVFVMPESENTIDLWDYISEKVHLLEDEAKDIFKQVLTIVYELFNMGIVHCDIKDNNILINTASKEITLIDFGFAAFTKDSPYTEFRGTESFLPPEWFKYDQMDAEPLTVWSLGLLLFDMLHGDIPYEEPYDIVKNNLPKINYSISDDAMRIIKTCLSTDPKERPKLVDLINDAWILGHH